MNRRSALQSSGAAAAALLTVAWLLIGAARRQAGVLQMGRQSDGTYIVSSGQTIAAGRISFEGRATDLALHPSGSFFAVVAASRVFLCRPDGILEGSTVKLPGSAAFHGICWSHDGSKLYVSVSTGVIQELTLEGEKLALGRKMTPKSKAAKGNPNPGGIAVTRDGKTLFVADCDRNTVAQIDLTTGELVKEIPTQNLPFTVKLSADEQTLIVSDWGGYLPKKAKTDGDDEEEGKFGVRSGDSLLVANPNGSAATGSVDLIDLMSGFTRNVTVGEHPTDIAVSAKGPVAYVANAASDTISVVDTAAAKVTRTISLDDSGRSLWGHMPCAVTLSADEKTLYACSGGDNALAVIDIRRARVNGYFSAGYFPIDAAISPDGKTAYVVNTKGNGSVVRTGIGKPGNVHDFQGSVSVIDLSSDLDAATRQVATNAGWNRADAVLNPNLTVYKGAIKHVLYIIKENRSYDEVFGDIPEGNGDAALCDLGDLITPNVHALARAFTLFDNGYVSGTNSADGHCWTDQAVANDYLEHLYTDYRTYPDGEDDAMSIDPTGCLWDAALKQKKSVRVYGEASDYDHSFITPEPKSWLDVYHDRLLERHQVHCITRIPSLKPLKNPNYLYWPLLQPDQSRADIFIKEYDSYSVADMVPNLMVMSLPCDHTEGMGKKYPKPQSMVADNDLALGRIVEAISHSPQWKDTCIFVIEDDAQAGLDHVDGHRTVFTAYSPYIRRHFVDSNFYTTVSMLHSIELMLGISPMNRFDQSAPPLSGCFTDTPDLTPFVAVPAKVRLDDMNDTALSLSSKAREWAHKSDSLDWSAMDRADPSTLSQIIWHSVRGIDTPYPAGFASSSEIGESHKPHKRARQEDPPDND